MWRFKTRRLAGVTKEPTPHSDTEQWTTCDRRAGRRSTSARYMHSYTLKSSAQDGPRKPSREMSDTVGTKERGDILRECLDARCPRSQPGWDAQGLHDYDGWPCWLDVAVADAELHADDRGSALESAELPSSACTASARVVCGKCVRKKDSSTTAFD